MATSNSIFELAETLGINSPFGNWQTPLQRGFVKDFSCDFTKLIGFIQSNRESGRNAYFRYSDYKGIAKATRYTRFGPVEETSKKIIPFKYKKEASGEQENELNLSVMVNSWEGWVNFKEFPKFRFSFNQETSKIKFSLLFQYELYADETDEEKFAIILSAGRYADFADLLAYLKLELIEHSKTQIINEFSAAFKKLEVKGNANRIDWLYEQAPDFVLAAVKSDVALYSDLLLLSNNSIDSEGTNENVAIVNLLNAFRDKAWFAYQVNKNPDPLRKILKAFGWDYFPDLLLALVQIGLGAWDQSDIKKNEAIYYIFGVQEIYLDDDDSSDITNAGYSIYLKESNLFQIGYVAHSFKKGDFVATGEHEVVLGKVSAYSPVRTIIDGKEVYIPAIIAEYFTNQEIDKGRKLAINSALPFLLPEFGLIKLKTFTSIVNRGKSLFNKSVDELVEFLKSIKGEFKAVDLEKYGVKVLFRGTTRSTSGDLFLGNANTIANGISTSTDPIRATIFAIESATQYGQKGVLQIAIPKELKKLFLLPGNRRIEKELEIILQTGAKEFSQMAKIEIPVSDARRIISELYDVHLPTKIRPVDAINNMEQLFMDIPRLSLEDSYKFYKQILK
jgi:hypothetical protein